FPTAAVPPAYKQDNPPQPQDAGGTTGADSSQQDGGFPTAAVPPAYKQDNPPQPQDPGGMDPYPTPTGAEYAEVRSRGKLPHWHKEGAVYFVTFRLADSLPQPVLAQIQDDIAAIEQRKRSDRPLSKADERELARLSTERIQEYLDTGAGACHLQQREVAVMVRDAFHHFHGKRYQLHAWCIMPNHVHLLLTLAEGETLPKVMHSIKSYTAKRANKILGRSGPFWQKEYYDRIVRDAREYERTLSYIEYNPEAAGLADWPYVSDILGSEDRTAGVSPAHKQEDQAQSANTCRQDAGGTITKWDIFHYVYGLLHHPGYREKYADCLKRDLPRIPYAPDFWAFANAGRELAGLHLEYEDAEEYPLEWITAEDRPLSYRVEKMRLSKDKTELTVNDTLTLAGIPPETFRYRLGNRGALEWVIDQYQVKTDKRSGITSDPNRDDDPEYIIRLVGKVLTVSLETVRIVEALPEDFGG
ncbi:MAG: REP-associated tyrosine transposase, partial [Candidatus Hydrogenedentota bacterium]